MCRTIYFPTFDGVIEWEYDKKQNTKLLSEEVDENISSQRLRAALDPEKGNFLPEILISANHKLNELRRGAP